MQPPLSIVVTTLLRGARTRFASDASALDTTALPADMDWTALIEAALRHGTAGLLCDHLLALPPDRLPADVRDASETYIQFLRAAHADGVTELHSVLDVLAAAGVTGVPFKGPALAQLAYPDPPLRRFTDLDILIAEADVPAAMDALLAQGYRSQNQDLRTRHLRAYWRYNGQDVLHRPERLPVEPHWLFGQRTLATALDMPAMLARADTLDLGGRETHVLSPEDSVIAAGFHGSKDEWDQLRAVADMAALLARFPSLNWDAVLVHAAAGGVRRMVLLGLALAVELLDARLPGEVARLIAADGVIQGLVGKVRARLFVAQGRTRSVFRLSAFRWLMRERLRDRLRYVTATLCTARTQHFRAVDLPDRLGFLYPGVKLGHDYIALPIHRLSARNRPS